ncbi:uncharacterized protein FYW47_002738 [Aplochiton taeniatus]
MSLSSVDFQSQIASIMEVLANAAVAEICKVVDDGYAVVQLEMSQSQKESDFLRRKIKLLELQVARYRAERMKCADASLHSRFQGVRLFNRHGRETLTGASVQNRGRLVKSSMTNRQRDSQTQSIDIDQDPQQEVVTTSRCESADPVLVEPELLIVKIEGALESDDQERPAEGRRDPTSPPGGLRDVRAVDAGCSQMEVSGSDVITVVVHQSETEIEGESTQNLLDTGVDTRAGGPNMDMPCDDDMVKKEEHNTLGSSLPLAWTELGCDVEHPYSCPNCSKVFFMEADLQRHLARHAREKAFVCQLCGKGFICQSQLDVHQNVHTGERPYSCLVCERKFSHPSNLRRHEKGQTYQNSSMLVKEESLEDTQDHNKDSTPTRLQSTAVERSEKHRSACETPLQRSGPSAEDKERPFSSTSMTEAVPGCSSSSPSSQNEANFPVKSKRLRGASALDQSGNPAVKSDVILIDSPHDVTPSSLWKRRDGEPTRWTRAMDPISMAYQHHVLPSQAQRSPDQLMYSGDVIRDLTAPSVPLSAATEERQLHQHQLLPPWFGFQEALQHPHQNPSTSVGQSQGPQSQAQPHPSRPPYSCPICGRQYLHLCQLTTHQRVHTGEKPFQCTQCGKQFGQFCSLKRHQRVHTGEKPYRCVQCGKQFSTSNNLKVHQSVHTGEKRFHCSQCGKNFSFLSNLIRHQAVHAAGK